MGSRTAPSAAETVTASHRGRWARKLRRLSARASTTASVALFVALAVVASVTVAGARIVNGCSIGPSAFCPGADLAKADLRGVTLAGADLSRTDLLGANLRTAILDHANLILADLRYADLRHVLLVKADLYRANLSHANLSHAMIGGGTVLLDAKFCHTIMPNGHEDNSGCG